MLDFSVTFIITIINIAVLFLVLRVVLFKRVTKFMDQRARRVQDSIDQSEKDKNQSQALLAKYEAQIQAAETEAEIIIRNAREYARKEGEKILAESRFSAEEFLAGARRQIEIERRAAMAGFRKEAAALVVEAAGNLVGREIKAEDSRQYADMLLREMSGSNGAGPENSGKS